MSVKRGGTESYYVLEKLIDPDILIYEIPHYCTGSTHQKLTIPHYTISDEYESYYWTLRRGIVRYILPVIPVLADFLAAYWFIKTNNYKEVILLSPYAGAINEPLKKILGVKTHFFTTKQAPNSYGRFPNNTDFKKLKGLPLINLSFFLYKEYNLENLFNGSLKTNEYANYLLEKFKPIKAMSQMVSYKADIEIETMKGILMMFPYRSCTSNQKFYHYYNGGNEKMKIKLLEIFGRLCIFDFCTRNLNHSPANYENWDLHQFFNVAGPNWRQIEAIFGTVPKARYNDPKGLDYPVPRDPLRFLNKIPGDLNLQNSYVSAFAEDINIPFKRKELDNYDFIWCNVTMNNCNVTVINEAGYKSIRRCLEGFDLKKNEFLILTYKDFLYNILMYYGKIYCLEETTEFIKKHINNTNYYSFNKWAGEKINGINFITWEKNKWTDLALESGKKKLEILAKKIPGPHPKRIWLEFNLARDFMTELLHAVFPKAVILTVGTTEDRPYVVNYLHKAGVIKPEEGDWIWKS